MKRLLLLALCCLTACLATAAPSADAAPPVLAATPYMGWNTYYGVGGVFDQQTMISVAESLIDRGLARAGYRIVWLDFGWASGARDANGNLIVDPAQWPNGLPWLTGWLHAHGLLAGIYTDAGATGCYGQGVGSLGHYQQDADTFAAWGFDAVKVDFCGAGQEGLDSPAAVRPVRDRVAQQLESAPDAVERLQLLGARSDQWSGALIRELAMRNAL